MKIFFNKNKISRLLQDFYNYTHLPISLFDADYKCLAYAQKNTNFCTHISSYPEIKKNCDSSTAYYLEEAKKRGETVIYRCHAGIIDTITPIFYQNAIIAYIMVGQFRDKEKAYSTKKVVESCLSKYDVDLLEFKRKYDELPCISSTELHSLLNILKLCIKYLWSEQLIQFKTTILASEIENYIDSHLAEDISVEILCKKFFISRQSLYSLFKNGYNDSVKNFINSKRLNQAKKLLTETSLSVSKIATQVGFADYNYFIRTFKSKFKITPLQYRFSSTSNLV